MNGKKSQNNKKIINPAIIEKENVKNKQKNKKIIFLSTKLNFLSFSAPQIASIINKKEIDTAASLGSPNNP